MNTAVDIDVYTPSAAPGGVAIKLDGKPGSGLSSSGGAFGIAQIEALVADLTDALDKARDLKDGPFVQVRFLNGGTGPFLGKLYTYRDPSGSLKVGDTVEVQGAGSLSLATVEKLVRGDFKGNILDVKARLVKENLAA